MSVNKVNSDGSLLRVAGGTLYADAPIGTISPFGGSVIPSGYLLCDGQEVSRTNYAELFAVIGTAFGSGDGSTTFNVPDLREATIKGVGLSGKSSNHYDSDGVALGEFVEDRIKSHAHYVYVRDVGHTHGVDATSAQNAGISVSLTQCAVNITPSTMSPTTSTGSGSANIQVSSKNNFSAVDNSTAANGSATNEVKAVGVNYIIKAKQVALPADIAAGVEDMLDEVTAVIPTEASTNNKLVTESEISKTGKTLNIGGSASAIVKIDVSVPFLDTDYGKFTEIDFQVRSDNIRFFISANDGTYLVTAQHNYRSSGWLTELNYLVNGSKSISLYVSILNYPANVGAKLVFNGLDGAEITEISRVDALPSGYASIKQFPIIYTADLTSTVTSGSTAPITSGGVYSALAPLRYAEVSDESQMRALYSNGGGMKLVRLSAAITIGDITIPVGTEGIFFAGTSDRHFIGQYYDSAIYSWFMNSNGTNTIRKFSTSN